MPRQPRTTQQKELHRLEIAKLMRRGWSANRIAEQLGVSTSVVNCDWKIVVKEVQQSRNMEAVEKLLLILEEIREVKLEAWLAWEESKNDAEKRVTEVSKNDKGSKAADEDGEEDEEDERSNGKSQAKYVKRTKSVEGRLPANEYMKTILGCLDREVELQGLNPDKEISMSGQVSWDAFAEQADGTTPDVIEAKLAMLMGQGKVVEVENFEVVEGQPPPEFVSGNSPMVETPVDKVRRMIRDREASQHPELEALQHPRVMSESSENPPDPVENYEKTTENQRKTGEKPAKTKKKHPKPGAKSRDSTVIVDGAGVNPLDGED